MSAVIIALREVDDTISITLPVGDLLEIAPGEEDVLHQETRKGQKRKRQTRKKDKFLETSTSAEKHLPVDEESNFV